MHLQAHGVVTKYKGNGRKLGYPTANFTSDLDIKDGVYFGYADLKDYQHHPALIFVGVPTTMGDTERRVEVHLLGIPDVDYYGEKVSAELVHFHRQNQTFDSVDTLVKTMHNDEISSKKWFDANTYA